MEGRLDLFSKYLYTFNKSKMVFAHLLDLAITANTVGFPLFVLSSISGSDPKKLSNNFFGISVLSFLVNTFFPRLKDLLIAQARNDAQKNITLDLLRSVYARELDTLMAAPTGACAVVTSRTYGSAGEVPPIFFSGIMPNILETLGISAALSHRYGTIGLSPSIILGAYLLIASYREGVGAKDKTQNSVLKQMGFGTLLNAINNYQIAHQYGNTEHELKKLKEALANLEGSFNEIQYKSEKSSFLLSMMSQLGVVATAVYAFLRPKREMQLYDFVLFGYYMFRFSSLLGSLPEKINTLYTGLVDAKVIVDFFQAKSKISEATKPLNLNLMAPPAIEFKGVNFKYGDNKPGLFNLSFSIKPGQKIVIMGATGSGKSTLLKLMQRFYDFEGEILINGIDIKQVGKADLRKALAVVTQDTALIDSNIQNNIKYGDLGASDEDVQIAAKFAGLKFERDRFFANVQQQGFNFSGGEKQRINVARALLKKGAYVFLLDEPTSALDQQTSQEVFKTINQLTENNATTMIVTHDPYVAVSADQVLYLDQGKIIEKGTFTELMALKGAFYKQMQAQCEKLGIAIDEIKPANRQTAQVPDDNIKQFLEWRRKRNNMPSFPAASAASPINNDGSDHAPISFPTQK
jgi:ATP-binding cassette subfamily B protein